MMLNPAPLPVGGREVESRGEEGEVLRERGVYLPRIQKSETEKLKKRKQHNDQPRRTGRPDVERALGRHSERCTSVLSVETLR